MLVLTLSCSSSIFGIFGNGLVLYCIINNKQIRTYKAYTIVANLTVADLLLNLLSFLANFNSIHQIVQSSFYWCHLASLLSLVGLNLEKHIYIVHPFHHNAWVSGRRIAVSLLFCWLLAAVGAFLLLQPFWTQAVFFYISCYIVSGVFVIIPTVTSLLLSLRILQIVVRHLLCLRHNASINGRQLSAADRSKFRWKLWRAVIFVLATTGVSGAIVLSTWAYKINVCHNAHNMVQGATDQNSLRLLIIIMSLHSTITPWINILTQKLYRQTTAKLLSPIWLRGCLDKYLKPLLEMCLQRQRKTTSSSAMSITSGGSRADEVSIDSVHINLVLSTIVSQRLLLSTTAVHSNITAYRNVAFEATAD